MENHHSTAHGVTADGSFGPQPLRGSTQFRRQATQGEHSRPELVLSAPDGERLVAYVQRRKSWDS